MFQQQVGSLTWLAHQTRPEIMIATSFLASHSQNPGPKDIDTAMHVMHYLKGSMSKGLLFSGSNATLDSPYPRRFKLEAYVDANLGGDAYSEHSRSCFMIKLNGSTILTKVMKQTRVARSTGHAEMQALCLLGQSLMFCADFMTELGYIQPVCRVLEDNSSCVIQAGGDHQNFRSGHYRRDQATVDEMVNSGRMFLDKIESEFNCADLGTKAVKPIAVFEMLRDRTLGYDTTTYMSPKIEKLLQEALLVVKKN